MINFFEVAPGFANQLSCLTGIILWTGLLLLVWKKLEVKTFRQAFMIGLGWLVGTILFETFIIGRNLTWSQILRTYDLSGGEYWGLVVAWIGLLPIVAHSFYVLKHFINNWGATAGEQQLRFVGEEFLRSPQIAD